MVLSGSTWNRLALITALVKEMPGLGRTAIMKLPFFLVVLRNVPLDYDLRLYTYGPFDSNVLDDLSYAESLEAVKSELIYEAAEKRRRDISSPSLSRIFIFQGLGGA